MKVNYIEDGALTNIFSGNIEQFSFGIADRGKMKGGRLRAIYFIQADFYRCSLGLWLYFKRWVDQVDEVIQ